MGYAWWHGKTIRKEFEKQAIDKLNPQSYDLTRSRGRILLNVRCPMSERINTVMTLEKLSLSLIWTTYPLRMTQSFAVLKIHSMISSAKESHQGSLQIYSQVVPF